jgi:hypothetical protein
MDYSQYKLLEFRRKFWVIVGAKIHVTDPASERNVGFIQMKAWKLREDVRLFTDETMQQEVIRIHARTIIDIGATYDVFDSRTGEMPYSLRRKGLKSIFVRDHWDILDPNGNIIGEVQETSSGLALARRWLGIIPYVGPIIDLALAFFPQTYVINVITANGKALLANLTHRKNPFIVKMSLDTSAAQVPVDPRLTLSITSMLSVIDGVK